MNISVKRKSDIVHYSAGVSPALEFPLKQQIFELAMHDYQALTDYFNPYCTQCKQEFTSYPDFVQHKHAAEKN